VSTVQEIKTAVAALSPVERAELAHWLAEGEAEDARAKEAGRRQWHADFVRLVRQVHAAVGPVTWTREQLHER